MAVVESADKEVVPEFGVPLPAINVSHVATFPALLGKKTKLTGPYPKESWGQPDEGVD
jgi:hypothetical protein